MCNKILKIADITIFDVTHFMEKLVIQYRFKGYPYIVADASGNFYQLEHTINRYTRSFRKLNLVLNNKITEGYRINRKFISLKQLRKLAYNSPEIIHVGFKNSDLPF